MVGQKERVGPISGGSASRTAQSGSTACDQSISLSANKTYKIVYDLTVDAGSFNVRFSGTTNVNGETRTTSGTYTDYLKAATGNNTFRLVGADSTFTGSIDNVSVKEVGQDWNLVNNTGTSSEIINGYARIKTDGAYTQIDQSSVTTSTKSYKLQYTILESDGGNLGFIIAGNQTGLIPTTIGTHVYYFVAHSTSIVFKRYSGALDVKISNISVKEIQVDVPRIDFTDDPTGHLLLEPQSTNLLPYSEDFSQWQLGSNSTLTYESNVVAPDGSLGVYRLTLPAQSGTFIYFSISNSNQSTCSVYAKSASASDEGFNILLNSGSSRFSTNNEWQRFEFTDTSVNNVSFINTGDTFVTDIYIWGAQFEQQSYPTSYIPTSGSAVTRNQEICNNSGTVNDFNSEEGVLYAEIAALVDVGTSRRISLSDGTSSNRLFIELKAATNQMRVEIVVGSGVFSLLANIDKTIFNKIAFSYKSGDSSLFINGVKISNSTSSFVFNNNLSKLSFENGFGGNDFFGKTKNVKAFKRALTDAELYLLTVTQYQSYQEMATALNYTL